MTTSPALNETWWHSSGMALVASGKGEEQMRSRSLCEVEDEI